MNDTILVSPTTYVALLMAVGLTRAEATAALKRQMKEQEDDYENRRREAAQEAGTDEQLEAMAGK